MSSAAILFCVTVGTLIPHASPSLHTRGGACEHPTAVCAMPGVCTSASYRGGNPVRGTGRSERGRERGWSRGGNGDGNGDVDGHRDGDGAGTGTGLEVNEEAQGGNGDGSEGGAGTGTGTGCGPVDEQRMGTGTGTGTEATTVAEMGTGTAITGTRIGSGRAEERRKSARNRKIVVDAVRETGETWVEREKSVEKKGLVQ